MERVNMVTVTETLKNLKDGVLSDETLRALQRAWREGNDVGKIANGMANGMANEEAARRARCLRRAATWLRGGDWIGIVVRS